MTLGTLSTLANLSLKLNLARSQTSFRAHVFPRDVKSALCLVVNLFLEQTKVDDEFSKIHDSLMKLIKTSAINETLHADSFGKMSLFLSQIKCIHLIYGFKY
jgi:hypothetical protein